MRITRTTGVAAAAIAAIGLTAAACGSGGSGAAKGGGTVTVAVPSDPGTLAPFSTVASTALAMNEFAYDPLVHSGADGGLLPGIAEKWSATSTMATFTLRQGVTCEDGSALTASDVAAVYNYVADPKNQSPLLGVSVPATATATADDATRTVTVRTKKPAPFFVEMAELLPITCKKALANTKALARSTAASGPYRLTEAVPSDHYTYVKRPGYTWGPPGTDTAQMPDKVVFKVVTNEATAANLLLSGEINAAQINGPDRQRLQAAKVMSHSYQALFGQFLFNEASGHPTADPTVRRALIGALDLKQIGSVATGGLGKPATNLGEIAPTPCSGDTVTSNLPAHDTAQAAAALTGAGWTKTGGTWTKDGKPLSITVPYPTTRGPRVVSALELARQQWTAFGARVTLKPLNQATVVMTLSSDRWDLAWAPIGVGLPDQLTMFYSGPVPPRGTNFGRVDNPDYQRLIGQAAAKPGKEGCPLWNAADASLVKHLDVAPVVSDEQPIFAKGIAFRYDGGGIVPTTLRKTSG